MYEIIREDEGRAIGVRTGGPLSDDDRRTLSTYLDDAIDTHGTIRLLVERHDPSAAETEGTLGLDLERSDAVERIAIVGRTDEQRQAEPLARAFANAEIEFYDTGHLTEAWSWVRGKV